MLSSCSGRPCAAVAILLGRPEKVAALLIIVVPPNHRFCGAIVRRAHQVGAPLSLFTMLRLSSLHGFELSAYPVAGWRLLRHRFLSLCRSFTWPCCLSISVLPSVRVTLVAFADEGCSFGLCFVLRLPMAVGLVVGNMKKGKDT